MKLASELKGAANVTDSGSFKQPAGPKPALLPGQSATFTVTASRGEKWSFATMFVRTAEFNGTTSYGTVARRKRIRRLMSQ